MGMATAHFKRRKRASKEHATRKTSKIGKRDCDQASQQNSAASSATPTAAQLALQLTKQRNCEEHHIDHNLCIPRSL
jgi:hypothetical protein